MKNPDVRQALLKVAIRDQSTQFIAHEENFFSYDI